MVVGCGNRDVSDLVLMPMSPAADGLLDSALLILQIAWPLGYTTSYGYLPVVTSPGTTSTRGGWSASDRAAMTPGAGRIWRSQATASAAGWGSRRARSQSTVRLMPSVRSVSGFQPSSRPARVGSNALA
jgi:hypothetical protein